MLTLMRALKETTGDVCEMGAGFSSTPLLHWLCLGRNLVTYESDPDYANLARKFRSVTHKSRHVDASFDDVDYDRHWGIVFIDHSPRKPRTRGMDAARFKNADIIILHDTEPESLEHYGYHHVFPLYKYRYDWTLCKPHCSAISNIIDVSQWSTTSQS